ncbi:LTA synthase family protein [Dysgonomonas sp. Marseille-P4361]|uniref:LTA synthase family protein n=1 Tax=Dysgonomonas sp. Marseille-P4361 TaxID=2161820 RepID=UPI002101ABF2|nr:LTA synthase family protein [Dysgonomonas sp. Marseille-P4361]
MKKIRTYITYILSVHLLALLFMTSQRIVLLLTNLQHISDVDSKFSWIFSALLRGVWFDNVIACYISIAPLAILSILGLFNIVKKPIFTICNIFYIAVYTLLFAIGTANIPYFHYFFKHLNNSIFNWNEEGGTTLGMVTQETSYYIYMVFFLISIVLFGFLLFRISKQLLQKEQISIKPKEYLLYIPIVAALIGLCLFGIRGRMGYNPIRTSQAYFCTNSFLNQLGINPSFYLMRDIIESGKSHHNVDNIISEEDAIAITQETLNISSNNNSGSSPIVREIITEGEAKNMNVIVVLMESMSSDFLDVKENGQEVTPYINQLKRESYYFNNFYSAGTHTNHGVLATLYGLPSLFDRNMMKNVDIPLCQGLPNELQKQGYRTMFFMTHEAQYDNMNAFLYENGIDEVYAEENYPREKRRNSFGVADDFLMEYGLNKINEKAKEPQPFFATLLTISNHPPYIIPEKYKSISKDTQYQILAFADDAIRQFMEGAKEQEWYDNTIFVFLGDHGKIVGSQTYDMPLSYNHIPLIIYSPSFADAPQQFEQFGGQVDVFPTVMGLLNRPYTNNTFGVDLFKENRPYMFFSSDDALGCIDQEDFYSYNFKANIEGLYKYRENNPQNFIEENKTKADSMKAYSAAMLQTASYMFKNRLLRVEE